MARGRCGITLVEALVALAVLGVSGSTLAATLAASSAIRARAAADQLAAAAAADRIAQLAHRACAAPDTGATVHHGYASERWSAVRTAAGWAFTISVTAAGVPVPATVSGELRCAR